MRHDTFGPIHFFYDIARIRGDLLVQYQTILLTSNERLRQIDRIINNIEPRQDVTAPYPVCGYGYQITVLDTVSPKIFFFEVSGRYFQRVAFPFPGGEAAPGVRCILRRMSASVQVDGVINGTQPFSVKCIDLPCDGIYFLRDSQLGRPAINISESMRSALPFGQSLNRCSPGFASRSGRVAHRNSKPVTDVRIPNAIFVAIGSPFPRKINLGERWNRRQHDHKQE